MSRFESKDDADKIMSLMSSELDEMKGNNRIKLIEGSRVLCLGQDGRTPA